MSALRKYLESFLQYSEITESIVKNIDANDTGIDDQIATFIDVEIQPKIRAFLAALPSEPVNTVATGYTAILAFCSNVLQSLDLLIESKLSKEEKLVKGKELVASLSDSTKVFQAKKGKDAEVLSNSKEKAIEKLTTIKNQ